MADQELTRQVPVKIFTNNNIVTGYVHVATTGYRSRVSDLLNQEGFVFLPVTEAKLHSIDGDVELGAEECVILNKNIIQAVIPTGGDEDAGTWQLA